MTIMLDEDEDSDCLYIDEQKPTSPKIPTSDNQNTSPGNTTPESNKETNELRNVRKNPEPQQVNYLPLMRHYTLNTIKNNILNASERKPKITIRDFARIPDATNSNENGDSALFSLLTDNSTGTEQHTANPTDDALKAEAQINDPRVHVTETWVSANSNAYRATTATDYQIAPGCYAGTPQDQRVPIPQTPFGVQNANIPHMPSAPSMKASVIILNPGIHSGAAMTYGHPPPTQGHNGVHTNFPTAMTNVWPVQNGHQAQMYTDAYNRQYGHDSAAPAEYNEQATVNYYQKAPPPMNCPPGCYCRHQMNMSAQPSNPQPTYDPRLPPYMYSMGMASNGVSLASTNPHDKRVPMPNSQNFPWNGYGKAYSTKSTAQNSPYSGRDTPAYNAEMHKQAHLQRNSYRMESMRIETTNIVSASTHVKERSGVKTTNKRAYNKVSTNNTQIVINTNSEIHANSTHNNVMGDGIGLNIPNLAKLTINNVFGTEEITARKQNTNKNTNTSKAKALIPVNHQVHAPSNIGIPTSNNIEIPSIDLTSASLEHSMNNIPNLTQPPLNTDAHLTTMTTNTPEANIATVSHYIDVDKVEAPMNKEGNLQPTAMNISNDGAQNVLTEAPQTVVNINMSRDSAQVPLIMNQREDTSLNIDKAHVKTTMLNSEGNLATSDLTTTAETLQTSAFIQPPNNNAKQQIALNFLNKNDNRTQTDATPTPKTLVQASSNANINMSRDSAQVPLIMNQREDTSLNIDKAHVKTTLLNSEGNLATSDFPTTAETLQTSAFIQPPNNNTKQKIALNFLNKNDNRTQTDATPTPKTLVQASSNANINMSRDSAQVPLIMDQREDTSLNIDKAHVKTTLLNSEGNLATSDLTTTAETLETSAFIQSPNNNTKQQIALNFLNKNDNRTQTNATPSPKTLVQASSNAYEVKVSTTSTRTEKILHNIESNAVLTSATMNSETDSIPGVAREHSILKTVDNRTETIVTTVGVVNHVPDISIQTLRDILNNAQQISTKTASNDNRTYDNHVSKCDDTENYTETKKIILYATADDHSEARIDHEPDVMIVSKQDEKFEMARKKLARFRAVEHENSSCKHVEKNTQRDIENQYQIKISTGLNGEYITQVTSVSSDRFSTKTNENVSHSQRRQETELLDGNRSIENNQEINEAMEPSENLTNITRDEAQLNIDETIFFKFQINFFRLVQERLSENNCLELADELSKDIHDLIAISDDEHAKADIKYKCHVCRNIAIYSPRSLYYEVTNHLEECLDKTRNCPLCITFRKKYIDILIKYIEIEAPEEALNSKTNSNAAHADDATINSSKECQIHSENSVPSQENGLPMDSKQEEYSDLENQLSLITNGVPSSPKKAKIDDQARANAKRVLDVRKTTQDGNTNAFVVKLPTNRLKESTVEALMQSKTVKSNAIQATLNIGPDDNSNKVDTNSENRERRKIIITETITSTIAEQRYTTVNNSTNNSNEGGLEVGTIIDAAINRMYGRNIDKNKENPLKPRKSISTEDPTGTNSAAQNRNSNPASEYDQDNNKNKEKHRKKRISISIDTLISNPTSENQNRPLNDGNNDTNQASRHKIRKSRSVETVSTTNPANPTNNDHIDENQEKHRKRKSISSVTYPEPQKKITNSHTTHTLDVASKNKENHNNIERECELREITDTSSRTNKTNTSSNATSIEATNKSISESLPETTADIAEKDDASRSEEKRENNEKIHNNDTLNDGRQTARENHDGCGDNATRSVEKALSDCQNTIKENCISNEQELPQVNIYEKKQKNKITKSKDHQPLTEITYEYRCSECTVGFRYLSSCLGHMTRNHKIHNPVVPLHCITMGCAFCDLFVMPKLYNNHIKTIHKDKFTKHSQKVEH